MASRSRKRKTTGGAGPLAIIAVALSCTALGVVGGYAWRSYAPLRVAALEGSPLASDAAAVSAQAESLEREAADLRRRARSAEEQAAEATAEVRRVRRDLEAAERQLADIQIREALGQ